MAINKERIRQAALNLIRAFDELPPEAQEMRYWRRSFNSLIEKALNGEINEPFYDAPGGRFNAEGGFRDYPDLEGAIAEFKIEIQGWREDVEEISARFKKMDEEKKNQSSD